MSDEQPESSGSAGARSTKILAAVTAVCLVVFTALVTPLGQRLVDSLFANSQNEELSDIGDGAVLVSHAEIVPAEEAVEMNYALKRVISASEDVPDQFSSGFEEWVAGQGGGRVYGEILSIVLTNVSDQEVAITGVRAEILQREPTWTGTRFCVQPQGASSVVSIYLDLNEPGRGARVINESGFRTDVPYFATHFVRLAPGEVIALRVDVSAATGEAVEWRALLDYTSGGESGIFPVMQDDGGSFILVDGAKNYGAIYYIGDVLTTDDGFIRNDGRYTGDASVCGATLS